MRSILIIFSLISVAVVYLRSKIEVRDEWLNYNKADLFVRQIADRIEDYHAAAGNWPSSLEQLVAAGYLDQYSEVYMNPMLRRDDRDLSKKLHYANCEFILEFKEDATVIKVPVIVGGADGQFIEALTTVCPRPSAVEITLEH